MDGVSALSLAANIIQVINLCAKIFDNAKEAYHSTSGMTEENQSLENVVKEMQELSGKLKLHSLQQLSEDEKALGRLAQQCRILSDQILEGLKKIAPGNPGSKRQAISSALKHLWNKRDMDELAERLQSCRSQLALQLTYVTSENTRMKLANLASNADKTIAMLEEVNQKADELKHGVNITTLSDEAQTQFRDLLSTFEVATDTIKQVHIRKSLRFPEMRGRFESIEQAHEETFRWLIDDTCTNGVNENPQARDLFSSWLTEGNDIFHITGKLGSGKSTLMKLLSENKITFEKLHQWADNKKLVFASFFFWRPGSTLQRSLFGLMRSLLHDILKECPELVPDLFPRHWHQLTGVNRTHMSDIQFQDKEIQDAFSILTSNQDIYESRRFCFFIDGLDEYVGTHRQDYKFVTRELNKWNQSSGGAVKLCVSSRELIVFQDGFSAQRRLRLQDLTSGDRTRYVEHELDDMDDEVQKRGLVGMVVEQSDGIFLWIVLVVKRLRDYMEDEHSPSAWRKELQSLPRELEDLFEHLLQSVPEAHAEVPYQVVAIMNGIKSHTPYGLENWGQLTLFSYSFLDEYRDNKQFANALDFQYENLDQNLDNLNKHLSKARKSLNRCCKGLIEAKHIPYRTQYEPVIEYCHRSVPEFFQKHQDSMEQHLVGFDVQDAISQLFLAEIRATKQLPPYGDGPILRSLHLLPVIIGRIKQGMDTPPYRFLEILDAAIVKRLPTNNYTSVRLCSDVWGFLPDFKTKSVLIHLSAYWGHLDYVAWKLRQGLDIHEDLSQTLSLLRSLSTGVELKQLFELQTRKRFALIGQILEARASFRRANANSPLSNAIDSLYMTLFFFDLLLQSFTIPYNHFGNNSTNQGFGPLIKHVLNVSGFDPRVEVTIRAVSDQRFSCTFMLKIMDNPTQSYWTKNYLGTSSTHQFVIEAEKPITLCDLVDFWNLEDKEELKELINQRTKILDKAESYAAAFWGEAEIDLINREPEAFHAAYETDGDKHRDRSGNENSGNEESDSKQSSSDGAQQDETRNDEEQETLVREAWRWMNRVTDGHVGNREINLEDRQAMAVRMA